MKIYYVPNPTNKCWWKMNNSNNSFLFFLNLLCSRHSAKHLTFIMSFNILNEPHEVCVFIPLYRGENRFSEITLKAYPGNN